MSGKGYTRQCNSMTKKNKFLRTFGTYVISYEDNTDYAYVDLHLRQILTKFPNVGVLRKFSSLLIGFSLQNASHSTVQFIKLLPGVVSIRPSKKFYATNIKSWGQDRLDQKYLPLDGKYYHEYDGTGVNVFVVDTGIDTTHREFPHQDPTSSRIVRNVFDVSRRHGDIPEDNDGIGHGTHVAATIGGKYAGVSPGANIYGIKVLDDQGAGEDTDVLDGLSYVYEWFLKNKSPPTVVSMSLGGSCLDYTECAEDLVVKSVEKLTAIGIVVVVAAGNDNCDSCLQTPAYAASAITVGAISSTDDAAIFSDFGKCVDIYAPGQNITSACATNMCAQSNGNAYISLSGTSMACPHASGVAAQILEIHPEATPLEVSDMMSCIAVKDTLTIRQDTIPSVTRNLLLQVPSKHNVHDLSCNLGTGCPGDCSGVGLCQMGACLCDREHWGRNCSVREFGKHCDDGYVFVEYTLWDADEDSWQGSELRVSRIKNNQPSDTSNNSSTGGGGSSSGSVVGINTDTKGFWKDPRREANMETILTTSMCVGEKETSGMCLSVHERYNVEVTAGPKGGADASWSICGSKGGVPFLLDFEVNPDGSCTPVCDGHFIDMHMTSTSDHGWGNGHYLIFDTSDGIGVAGGSMSQAGRDMYRACLTEGRYAVILSGDSASSAARRSSWNMYG
eukprot:gene2056-4018_t